MNDYVPRVSDDEAVGALIGRMQAGDYLIVGGVGKDALYAGLCRPDGSVEYATPAMARIARSIATRGV